MEDLELGARFCRGSKRGNWPTESSAGILRFGGFVTCSACHEVDLRRNERRETVRSAMRVSWWSN